MSQNPDDGLQSMIRNLSEKTGKSLAEWLVIAHAVPDEKHGAILKRLKTEHGLSHGYANLVAHETLRTAAMYSNDDDLVAQQYAGSKAGLKPIHDALMKAVAAFGADVEISPKKAYVSLRRSKQFALIQPSTATRLDVGLNLKGAAASGRLEASGSFNSMCSHRVRLASVGDVDAEVMAWLRQAYEAA